MTSPPAASSLALILTAVLSLGCATAGRTTPGKPAAVESEAAFGRAAIERMAGCYVVDYNYHETKALKEQYLRDPRVYDPNKTNTAMEWIMAVGDAPHRVRLQHVLFVLDEHGKLMDGSMMRHQAEDWEYEPAWVWQYEGDSHWRKVETSNTKGQWVRRITNLDDGLRYQCMAPWRAAGSRTEWSCGNNFSPIPGRETRDMKRTDYQGLMRDSRLVIFPVSWVERQQNVKTIVDAPHREPIAEEVGRNWYVRVDDSQCAEAAAWAAQRLPFWSLLQQTWATYFEKHDEWRETPPGKGAPRWAKMNAVEKKHFATVASDANARATAQKEISEIIEADRVGTATSSAAPVEK